MDNTAPLPKEQPRDFRFEEPTFIDPLTGLFNQYYLYRFLPEELKKAKLANYPFAVLMIDLDNFKAVNDKYGHLCGDDVLKQLADIFKNLVRKTDMLIRYAGDEFTVLLPTADLKTAQMLSQRFAQDISKNAFKIKDGQVLNLTISVGFSIYPDDALQIDSLIDLADKALYLSKQKGKNRVSHAKEVDLEAVSHMVAMESFPCPKFIDRKDQLERLKYLFDNIVVKTSLLQVACISGEAGIGKTRLISELSRYIQARAAVVSCRASYAHKQDPYFLFASGISSYIDKLGLDNPQNRTLFSQLSAEGLNALSLLIPAVGKITKRPQDFIPQDSKGRFVLFKAFLDFLIELNKIQPVFIYFDDMQWADKASLELLHYLSKQEKNKRIYIACSINENKFDEISDSDLRKLMEDISYNDNFTQVNLNNLLLEDSIEMNKAIFPSLECDKEFYACVYQVTKGNPSFVEELLKSLVENGVIFYQDNHWQIKNDFNLQDMPISLEDLIKRRLKNLDEETKEMIVQAAVVGEDFSVDLLKHIGNKDEGFTLELLNRAKKMRLIDELETKGRFGFINKDIRNALYNELSEQRRNELHYQIGKAIADQHKQNLANVAGELAFHFNHSPQQYNLGAYSSELLEEANKIFNPLEVMGYLDKLAKEFISAGEKVTELSDATLKYGINFIRILQGAVKNFQLYPPGAMRVNSVKEALSVLNTIWEENDRLTLGESERGLVINGKRITPKEAEQANASYFINLMLEQNLKAISFIKGMSENALDKFIHYFSSSYRSIKEKGGWTEIVKKEAIRGIKVDEVRFIQFAGALKEFDEKKRIEDVMLMEFLQGKVEDSGLDKNTLIENMAKEPKKFAQTVVEASLKAIKEGKADNQAKVVASIIEKVSSEVLDEPGPQENYAKYLADIILQLEPQLQKKVLCLQALNRGMRNKEVMGNVVHSVPEEMIIGMIIDEYKDSQGNLLVTKNLLENIMLNDDRRGGILLKLESELAKTNADNKAIGFIAERLQWQDLPIEKRIDDLLKMPDDYYALEMAKIKALLEELDAGQKKEELEKVLLQLIAKSNRLNPNSHKELISLIIDFMKSPFNSEKVNFPQMEYRLDVLIKRLNIELDSKVFSDILEILKGVVREFTNWLRLSNNLMLEMEKPEVRRYCLLIQELLNILSARYKWEENRNPAIHRIIGEFVREIAYSEFLEALIYSLINSSSRGKLDLKSAFPIIGERLVDTLLKLELQKVDVFGDSFREYVVKKGITDLLRELGDPALDIFREKFIRMRESVPYPLIELVGYLKIEDMIDLLVPLLRSHDPLVRRSTLKALGEIGTKRAGELINRLLQNEKDKRIRILAKEELKKIGLERKATR